MKIILNIFLIYSSGEEPHVFWCNNISALHKTVCVSSRIEFSPSGPMKRSTVQPPTGWTVAIAWYALIQHLLGLFYSPVHAVFTASALSTAYTSIKYREAGIHQNLFSHWVIDFFCSNKKRQCFFPVKIPVSLPPKYSALAAKTASRRKFSRWTLRLSSHRIPDKAPWEHKTSKRCTVGGSPAHNFSTVWKVNCKG